MFIEDGSGRGYRAKVNNDNMLWTKAIIETMYQHVNSKHFEAYQLQFNKAATGNDDCVLYMKNNSDHDLIIHTLRLSISTADEIYFKIGDTGTPVGGTAIIPVNLNAGSAKVAEGVFQHGVDITGLSGGTEVERIRTVSATYLGTTNWHYPAGIILPKNQTFTLWIATAATTVLGHVGFVYDVVD